MHRKSSIRGILNSACEVNLQNIDQNISQRSKKQLQWVSVWGEDCTPYCVIGNSLAKKLETAITSSLSNPHNGRGSSINAAVIARAPLSSYIQFPYEKLINILVNVKTSSLKHQCGHDVSKLPHHRHRYTRAHI